jgi:hypothetical protein
MAVDWYSRSIVAIRVLEKSEQAIDVTFLLREIGRPKAMLPGWTDENRWPFVGLPEKVLTDIYGGDTYSGMPFVNAEAVVTDHGNTYKAHLNVATASASVSPGAASGPPRSPPTACFATSPPSVRARSASTCCAPPARLR